MEFGLFVQAHVPRHEVESDPDEDPGPQQNEPPSGKDPRPRDLLRVELCLTEAEGEVNPAVFFGGMVVCYLLVAFVVAVLVTSLGLTTPVAGAALGVLLWLAVAAVGMTAHLAGDKPIGMYLIDVSFQLIFLVLMGAVLAAWR